MAEMDWRFRTVRGRPTIPRVPDDLAFGQVVDRFDEIRSQVGEALDEDFLESLRRSRRVDSDFCGEAWRDRIVSRLSSAVSRHATVVFDLPEGRWVSVIRTASGPWSWRWLFVDGEGIVHCSPDLLPQDGEGESVLPDRSRVHPATRAAILQVLSASFDDDGIAMISARIDDLSTCLDAATPIAERIDPTMVAIEGWLRSETFLEVCRPEAIDLPGPSREHACRVLEDVRDLLPRSREGRRRWLQGVAVAPFAWMAMLGRPDLVEGGSSPYDVFSIVNAREPSPFSTRIMRAKAPGAGLLGSERRDLPLDLAMSDVRSEVRRQQAGWWHFHHDVLKDLRDIAPASFRSIVSRGLTEEFTEAFNRSLEEFGAWSNDSWSIERLVDLPPALFATLRRDPQAVCAFLDEGGGDFVRDLVTHLELVDRLGGVRSPFDRRKLDSLTNGLLVSQMMVVERLLREEGLRGLRRSAVRWHESASEIAARRATSIFVPDDEPDGIDPPAVEGFECEEGSLRWLVVGDELRREGCEMDHCAGSYASYVEKGFFMVASLLASDGRGTVAYEAGSVPGLESRCQLRGPGNDQVSDGCLRLVERFEEAASDERARWPMLSSARRRSGSRLRADVTAADVLVPWMRLLPHRMRELSPADVQVSFLSICDQSPGGGPTTFLPLPTAGNLRD